MKLKKLTHYFTPEGLRKPLFIVASIAVVLGLITYFSVFYDPGFVAPNTTGADNGSSTAALISPATSTASSSTGALASSSASSTPFVAATGTISWSENGNQFTLNSASINNNQLTLAIAAQSVDGASGCVPTNLAYVADESGALQTPTASSSTVPVGDACNASVIFTVDPSGFPLLFTTGGLSNIFFEIATTTGTALQIELPPSSD